MTNDTPDTEQDTHRVCWRLTPIGKVTCGAWLSRTAAETAYRLAILGNTGMMHWIEERPDKPNDTQFWPEHTKHQSPNLVKALMKSRQKTLIDIAHDAYPGALVEEMPDGSILVKPPAIVKYIILKSVVTPNGATFEELMNGGTMTTTSKED